MIRDVERIIFSVANNNIDGVKAITFGKDSDVLIRVSPEVADVTPVQIQYCKDLLAEHCPTIDYIWSWTQVKESIYEL